MVRNPERRRALLDAALSVLAAQGARGLTFRAVDADAGVPAGTASNYFADRDDLLTQAGRHIYVRLTPDEGAIDARVEGASTKADLARLMSWTAGRMAADSTGYLALLELRLEATRRPALRAALTERIREDLAMNMAGQEASAMPGGRTEVVLLYLAINWLVMERLTLPGVLADEPPTEEMIALIVDRLVPEGS